DAFLQSVAFAGRNCTHRSNPPWQQLFEGQVSRSKTEDFLLTPWLLRLLLHGARPSLFPKGKTVRVSLPRQSGVLPVLLAGLPPPRPLAVARPKRKRDSPAAAAPAPPSPL
ncbi:wsp1, partial [Ophiophagus hannah]